MLTQTGRGYPKGANLLDCSLFRECEQDGDTSEGHCLQQMSTQFSSVQLLWCVSQLLPGSLSFHPRRACKSPEDPIVGTNN